MELVTYIDSAGRKPFSEWLLALVEAGNLGDCKAVRDGVLELRIDHGAGYRVYLSRQGPVIVLLLCASDKSGQARAIRRAIDYLNNWKERGKS